jgi:Ca2+-binding RTX toxin-like protein
MRLHASAALLAAILALLATASSAFAANITTTPAGGTEAITITYFVGVTETNDVTVTRSGNTLTFTEAGPGATLTESSDACTPPVGRTVTCTIAAGVVEVDVFLANQDDEFDATSVSGVRFEITGGLGADTLRGGVSGNLFQGDAGADTLIGGAGDDQFLAGEGADTIVGGGQSAEPSSCGDQVDYFGAGNLRITLDDVANDETGDGDVLTGIEGLLGGTGNDAFTGNAARNCLDGREGNDTLTGLAGDDFLTGGPGGDTLDGGDGDDELHDDTVGDEVAVLLGGNGTDSAFFCARTAAPGSVPRDMTITLDGIANDGPDANDNVDAEDLFTCGSADTVFGNAEFNVIRTQGGNDTVDPGPGSDLVDAGAGDDTINARDGFADRIDCGDGVDTANVDQLDTVRNCETVNREARPVALEDRPPGVTFDAPRAGARIAANTPTTLRASATDDRGVARVLFMDDDRVVCTDTEAPYECVYQPRAEDVNRNTLSAVAVDSSDQAGFATRTVTVPRFSATRLTATTTPRRDRTRPFRFTTTGRLTLPASLPVTRTACRGRISIQVKTGGSTISTRRTTLTRACTYRSRVTFRVPRRFVRRALKVTVRFGGNAVVAPRNAKSYFIRTS